jgi:hypothetical protein
MARQDFYRLVGEWIGDRPKRQLVNQISGTDDVEVATGVFERAVRSSLLAHGMDFDAEDCDDEAVIRWLRLLATECRYDLGAWAIGVASDGLTPEDHARWKATNGYR